MIVNGRGRVSSTKYTVLRQTEREREKGREGEERGEERREERGEAILNIFFKTICRVYGTGGA